MSAPAGFPVATISGLPVVRGPAEIDIANAGQLRAALLAAAAQGGELRLVVRAATLLRLFSITGVDHVIPNFTTLDQAVSELPAVAIRPGRSDVTGLPRLLSAS